MTLRVEEYVRRDGSVHFGDWFERLDPHAVATDGETLVRLFCGGTKKRQQSDVVMALTRDFKDTPATRVRRDPNFARALLDESATLFLNGEPEAARLLRQRRVPTQELSRLRPIEPPIPISFVEGDQDLSAIFGPRYTPLLMLRPHGSPGTPPQGVRKGTSC